MKIKKIILSMVSTLILAIVFISQSVFAAEEGTWKFTQICVKSSGISESNPEFAVVSPTPSAYANSNAGMIRIVQIGDGNWNRKLNFYCAKVDVGFENRNINPTSGLPETHVSNPYLDTYKYKYNMSSPLNNADKTSIESMYSNRKKILALADLFYLGNDENAFKDYIKPLINGTDNLNAPLKFPMLSNAETSNQVYNDVEDYLITPNQVRAVQQLALWYFTNGIEIDVNATNVGENFLYYKNSSDDSNYIQLNANNDANEMKKQNQNTQAKQLYRYLINKANELGTESYVSDRTKVSLYTKKDIAGELAADYRTKSQPIIEIEPVEKQFDLALRKYISSVTTNGTTTSYTASGERKPNEVTTKLEAGTATTADYKHRKDPIIVEKGSKVNYRLVIYNEGEIDGRATKVVDQLPAGVKFLSVVSGNFESDGTYTTTNNKLTLTRKSGNTTDLKAYTSGIPENEVIEIQCEVTADPDENNDKIYTNIAWIAEHKSNKGTFTDRDSVQTQPLTTLPELVTTEIGYTGKTQYTETQLENKNTYFEGQEDDDDFEKIKIKAIKGSYDIVLVKEDKNGEQLNETATFEVDGVAKQVTGRLTIVSNKKINSSNVGTVDTYTIKELVPPDKYCSFEGTIKIEVYKKQDGEKYVVDKIKYYVDNVEVTTNRSDLKVYLNKNGNIYVEVKDYQFDLALRKFITGITTNNTKTPITDREPKVTAEEKAKLANNQATYDNGTTASKTHKKDEVEVAVGDIVEYTIRVYNEGDVSGYASEVTDYLPAGLTFKSYTKGDGSINDLNGWEADGQKITTTKLNNQLINAFDGTTLDYKNLKIECIVNEKAKTEKASLMNIAEITEHKDGKGKKVTDRDSQPKNVTTNPKNYNPEAKTGGKGEQDDDDFEDLKIVEFDLALRKYITKVEDKDGNEIAISTRTPNIDKSTIPDTATYKHRKDPVVVKPGYFVYYDLTVYNEGNIDGFAKTITDQLPTGVKFIEVVNASTSKYAKKSYDQNLNVLVLERKENQGTIKAYNGTKLNSETVTIKCEVTADKETGSDKVYTNIAWISEDHNEKGVTDRDSKPVEHPNESKLVTDYPDYGYINEKDNKNKTLSNANEYFKGEQDDDDFEKIIIYKGPEIHKGVKTVKNQDSGYDEDVTTPHEWVINSSLPINVKDYKKYKIVDDIDYRLVYGEVKSVKIIDKDGNTVTELEEGENKDYTVNYTENTSNNVSQILGNKYSGTLTLTFIDTNKTISDKVKANGGNLIEVKFTTTFAKDENGKLLAEIIGKEIPNKAKLEYTNQSSEEGNEESEKPEVHTGGITLYKYETKDGKKVALKDAEFKIFRSKADATAKKNAVQTAKSNTNGLVEFVGLEYGEDAMDDEKNKQPDGTYDHDSNKTSTKYWIVETKAPKGYKTIEGPFEVTINNDSYKDDIEVLIREEESKQTSNRLIENKPLNFDLALRKFITAVNDKATKVSREPVVDVTNLKEGKSTTATYTHPKDPVDVVNSDVVSYSLRIYNEGQIDGYASIVTDDIPDGLEFLPEHNTNKEYRWVMYEELKEGTEVKDEDKDKVITCKVKADSKEKQYIETTDAKKAVIIRTDYLSKEQGEARMEKDNKLTENPNLLKAFDGEKLDYKDLKLVFRVTEPNGSKRTLINYAQISEDQDEDGNDVTDIDSTPDIWNEGEDDQDIEKLIVPNFDLALRKWVTQAIVIENGQETVTNTGHDAWDDPEEIVKVELHRKKLSNVTVKFRYSIRIYNQGELEGYAKEITDYIPEGLKFVAEDNPSWTDEGNNVISTRALENTLLKPGEYADVEVLLTWINGKDNLGLKVNTAEISEDYNEKGVPDCDSVPDNKKPGEDDIDDAPVMLSISTGMEATYIVLGTSILVILAGGIFLIKKYVL